MYLAPSMHSHEILIKILKGKSIHLVQVYYYYFFFREKNHEAQRGLVTFSKFVSKLQSWDSKPAL